MWRRRITPKSQEPAQGWLKWLNPIGPAVFAVVTTLLLFVIFITAGTVWDSGPWRLSEAIRSVPFFFVGFFVGGYIIQALHCMGGGPYPPSMICNQCYRVKDEDREPNCSCGGQFELLDNWEWVEDDHPDAKPETSAEDLKKV
jgi:hypothetical protein